MSKHVKYYKQVNAHSQTMDADPHRLIELLLSGAMGKIFIAKGCMERQDIAGKGINISLAITIIDSLRASLNLEEGGDIANNLNDLYEYMLKRLLQANMDNNLLYLDEVNSLLGTIHSGWTGIREEAISIIQPEQGTKQ